MHRHTGTWEGMTPRFQERVSGRVPGARKGIMPSVTPYTLNGKAILRELDNAGISAGGVFALYSPHSTGMASNELVAGEIRLPPAAQTGGKVYVNLYHAWSLQGELRHPLQLIEGFEAAPGAFSHRFEYPEGGGEGLVAYAGVDLEGDSVLGTPSSRVDLAGLAEVAGFPADRVSVTVDLAKPCRGPDWLYPRPAPPGT